MKVGAIMKEENNEVAIEAAKVLAKETSKPLNELLIPPCKVIGEGIASIFDIVFSPFKFLNSKIQIAQENFKVKLSKKLNDIPDSKLVEPELNKIGPILDASKFYVENDILSDMFANLLASSCNTDTINTSHVAFVEIIKQLTPQEALLIKELHEHKDNYACANIKFIKSDGINNLLVNYIHSNFIESDGKIDKYMTYLENLQRLKIIEVSETTWLSDDKRYDCIRNSIIFKAFKEKLSAFGNVDISKKYWPFTNFGTQFVKVCLK